VQALLNAWLEALQPIPDLGPETWRFGWPMMDPRAEPRGAEEVRSFHHLAELLREMAEALTRSRRTPVDATKLVSMALEALRQQLIPLQAGAHVVAAPLAAWLEAQTRPTLGPGRETQRRLGRVARAAQTHLDATSALAALHIQIVDRALLESSAQLGQEDGVILESVTALHAWLCAGLDAVYRRSAASDEHVEAFAAFVNSGVRFCAAVRDRQADAWERWGMPPMVRAGTAIKSGEACSTTDLKPAHVRQGEATDTAGEAADTDAAKRTPHGLSVRHPPPPRATGARLRAARAAQPARAASHDLSAASSVLGATAAAANPRIRSQANSTKSRQSSLKPEFDISLFAGVGDI
jgi:hypothetical protein